MIKAEERQIYRCVKWTPVDENEAKIYFEEVGAKYRIINICGSVLSSKGKFIEPLPSNRTEKYLKECRYETLEEAFNIYQKYKNTKAFKMAVQ